MAMGLAYDHYKVVPQFGDESDCAMGADVRDHIRQLLGVADTATAEEIAAAAKASKYAADYFMNEDYTRAIREKEVDILWKLAPRDVDSVLAAVCTVIGKNCLQVCACICPFMHWPSARIGKHPVNYSPNASEPLPLIYSGQCQHRCLIVILPMMVLPLMNDMYGIGLRSSFACVGVYTFLPVSPA